MGQCFITRKGSNKDVITFGVCQYLNAKVGAVATSSEVETNNAKQMSYYGIAGYGGIYIDGYNGSSWVTIYSATNDNNNIKKGILDISSYSKVRCRAKRATDDASYNHKGLWVVCTINATSTD